MATGVGAQTGQHNRKKKWAKKRGKWWSDDRTGRQDEGKRTKQDEPRRLLNFKRFSIKSPTRRHWFFSSIFANCYYRFWNKMNRRLLHYSRTWMQSVACFMLHVACCIFNVPNKNLAKQDKLSRTKGRLRKNVCERPNNKTTKNNRVKNL